MNALPSLAVVLLALANARGRRENRRPVPKDQPPPTIEGKYTLQSIVTPDLMVGPGGGVGRRGAGGAGGAGGGGGFPGGPGGGVFVSPMQQFRQLMGPVTIGKSEIVFEGNDRISPLVANGPTTMEYTLDPSKSPMTIDVEQINLRGKKIKQLGIVEVVGSRLILALANEGEARPKSTEEADGVTVYYLMKAPPPPRTEFRIVAMTVGKEKDAEKELNKLSQDGYELVTTTQPTAADGKSAPTTIHFVLKRTVR